MGRLNGKKIVVTRSKKQAENFSERLKAEGATVYEIPSIEIVERPEGISELKKSLSRISDYSWLVLTSINSVFILDRTLRECGHDWSRFQKLRIACIGKTTAGKVTELGGNVFLVPPLFQAESLAEEMLKSQLTEQRILLPRAEGSRMILPQQLTNAGAMVEEIHLYKAEPAAQSKEDLMKLLNQESVDFLTFTSSSTVRSFAELAGDLPWQAIPVVCIGPITAKTLRQYGVEPVAEAKEFTIEGLLEALYLTQRRSAG